MSNKPIGVFDSGVGGLTVLSEIRKQLPNENLVYLGDTANFPYGNKTKEQIIKIARNSVKKLIDKNVKVIVIACGTATSQALDILKNEFSIPIIGIINPTVKYVKTENIKKIGVIATEGTIKSNAWEIALKKEIKDIQVINKACPMLATIAEEGKAKSPEGIRAIKEYMKPFKENKVDEIILGCTHYPIYEDLIRKELEYDVELINTGKFVAKELENMLKQNNLQNKIKKDKEIIYLTKPEQYFKNIARNILDFDVEIK